jgi:chromosome segregation ATPase
MDKIIEQLKELKNIRPREGWVNAQRELLLSQITKQNIAKPQSFLVNGWYLAKSLMPVGVLRFAAKPVGVFVSLMVLVFSTGMFGVNASRSSLPGDMLYQVKLTSEKVKVGFTVKEEKKAILHVQFAEERVKEIETVSQKVSSIETKKEQIKVAAVGLKNEMAKTNETLDKVKQDQTNAKDVLQTVKNVDQKTAELGVRIELKKEEMKDNKEITKSLSEVKAAMAETGVKAVEVIVSKHESGAIKLSDTEIIETINNIDKKIESAQKKIDEVTAQVKEVSANVTDAEKQQAVATAATTENKISSDIKPASTTDKTVDPGAKTVDKDLTAQEVKVDEIKAKPTEAGQKLNEAKDLLNHGDLSSAIERVQQVSALTTEVQQGVNNITDKMTTINTTISNNAIEKAATDKAAAAATAVEAAKILTPTETTKTIEIK